MQAELRINRTPVSPNSKCDGCCHYDGNAISKGGACEVGSQPAMCGPGTEPRFGYAPLTEMAPGMVDSYATPSTTGSSGSMNEFGLTEQKVHMQTVVLGDEHLALANTVSAQLGAVHKGCYAQTIGQTSRFSPEGHAEVVGSEPSTLDIAKSLYDNYLRPREQHKFSLKEVLVFLGDNGFSVSDEELNSLS